MKIANTIVSYKAAKALIERKVFHSGNTAVNVNISDNNIVSTMRLHRDIIATIENSIENYTLTIQWGWNKPSRTTARRINTILSMLGINAKVSTRRGGILYIGDDTISFELGQKAQFDYFHGFLKEVNG